MDVLPDLEADLRPNIERMTPFDTAFLYAETPRTPLHVGSLSIFEGAPFFDERGKFRLDEVRRRISERLPLFPRFRKRVSFIPFDLGRPFWVDDQDFDIANHVNLMVLPSPGSRDELEALCDQLQMRLLDRDRPLWELWFIGGLKDGNVAMVEKVHHAMIDGVSGVDVAAALLDLERDPPHLRVEPWLPAPAPHLASVLIEGLREDLSQPVEVVRRMGELLSSPRQLLARTDGIVDALTSFLNPWDHQNHPAMHDDIGTTRRLVAVTESLDEVKRAGKRFDATVNDVVLTAVAGGVREFLLGRGESVDHAKLRVLVPVSVRADHEHLALGNRVSGVLAPLPLDEPFTIQRLALVRNTMRRIKTHHQSAGTEVMTEAIGLIPPGLMSLVTRSIHHQPLADMVVTNVSGPDCPLYFLGAEMIESIPIVPLGGNLIVGIAILSYNGALTLGLHADVDTCPDVHRLADGIRAAFAELIAFDGEPETEDFPRTV